MKKLRFLALTLVSVLVFGLTSGFTTGLAYQVYVGSLLPTNLQNGSFELVDSSFTRGSKANFVPQAQFPGWVTSDSLGQIEVWPSGLIPGGSTTSFPAATGNGSWFVEINANDGPGSYIYQDLSTIPGALYRWAFYHRGRNGTGTNVDVAAMLLGDPAGGALSIANAQDAFGGTQAPVGMTSAPNRLVANRTNWIQHLGYFQPVSTVTRFQLLSYSSIPGTGTGGGNQVAEGNLVDAATWIMVAVPTTTLVISGAPVDPNVVGQVANASGYTGKFADPYNDFITPGVRENVIVDVYDSNGEYVGSVSSTVLVYVALTVKYVNQYGVEIATSPAPVFFPANFANKIPADFTAYGAFDYSLTAPPLTIYYDGTGVTYTYKELRSDSAPTSGVLKGNATVIYVYTPQPELLTVRFVNELGVQIADDETVLVPNGSIYRVSVEGDLSDIDFPLNIIIGSVDYSFTEIDLVKGDPATGIMDGPKTVIVVYDEEFIEYTVSGYVYDFDGITQFAPLPDISIYFTVNGGAQLSVITDENGFYELPRVQAGSTVIIVPPDDRAGVPARPVNGYNLLNIQANMPDNNFTYVPLVTVSGNVNGLPNNEKVLISFEVIGPNGNVRKGTTTTDNYGNYVINDVAIGSQSVSVWVPSPIPASDFDTLGTVPPSGGTYLPDNMVQITKNIPPEGVTGLNFVYTLYYTVSGNVSGLAGGNYNIPIDYQITDKRTGIVTTGKITTDAYGNYTLPLVPTGANVLVTAPSYYTSLGETYIVGPLDGYSLTSVNTDMLNNDFIYGLTHTVSGYVSGLPNNGGIPISYTITGPWGGTMTGTVYTNEYGYYEITNVRMRTRIQIDVPADVGIYSASPCNGYDLRNIETNIPNNNFVFMPGVITGDYIITYDFAGGTPGPGTPNSYSPEDLSLEIPNPTRPGCTFDGWMVEFANLDIVSPTTPQAFFVILKGTTGNIYLRAVWSNCDETTPPPPPPLPPLPPEIPVPPAYVDEPTDCVHTIHWVPRQPHNIPPANPYTPTDDTPTDVAPTVEITPTNPAPIASPHFAYMIGYAEDGTIRPGAYITRAEVTTIFFRLITDEHRARIWSQSNSFADVDRERWYNNAISTMEKGGLYSGMPLGTHFNPNQPATRAEFAAMVANYLGFGHINVVGGYGFTDIEGHWASDAINVAYLQGWVRGFGDGTFRPNEYITRAQVAALINRALGRLPQTSADLLPGMITWPDNMNTNAWYFLYIQEATNSHYYQVKADGTHETWAAIIPPRQWYRLEKSDSTPYIDLN